MHAARFNTALCFSSLQPGRHLFAHVEANGVYRAAVPRKPAACVDDDVPSALYEMDRCAPAQPCPPATAVPV